MNELLLIAEIAIFFGGLLVIKKFYGVNGLFAWITIATCLAEIQVCKSITILGIGTSMGNVLFASTFLATDIIRENYGNEFAKKGPMFSILGALIYVVFAFITPIFIPADFDLAQSSMKVLLSLSLRVTVSSIVMLFVANLLDVFLYDKLYEKMNGKKMWLRNNICTIICNCTENYIFTFLAFYGVFDLKTVILIANSATLIEMLIALLDTPFLYLSKRIK